MTNSFTPTCPLCQESHTQFYYQHRIRNFWYCSSCQLVFVESSFLLSEVQEKARYDHHQNNPNDLSYQGFLAKLLQPLLLHLSPPPQEGLDFGSGPSPTLSIMLEEKGYIIDNYDPFYANNVKLLQNKYDFITSTEAIEHFYQPSKEWDLWQKMIKPNGILAIMTCFTNNIAISDPLTHPESIERFAKWYYKDDPTHVCFFHSDTFLYLIKRDRLKLRYLDEKGVIIMQKFDTLKESSS